MARAPSKSRFIPFVRELEVVVRRRAAEFVEAGSQVPAAGMFWTFGADRDLTGPVEAELTGRATRVPHRTIKPGPERTTTVALTLQVSWPPNALASVFHEPCIEAR